MGALSTTAKGWFEDWLTGDETVGFLVKLTLADATVRWAQIFKSPGFRNMSGDEEVVPRISFTSPFRISVLNEQIGQLDEQTGITSFEPFKIGTLEDGGFVLFNNDGELNSWVDDVWSDADGEIMIGTIDQADETTFETFFSFKVNGEPTWAFGGRGPDNISFLIKSSILNVNLPAQQTAFAGTGALEGTDSLEGVPKPRLFGRVTHMRPTLVVPANERYLVSSAAISNVTEAYEAGFPIGTDQFTVTAANGYFDLDNTAAYEPVTCDAQGELIDTGSYTDDAGKILNYLIGTLWSGSVDSTSVTNYSTDFTAGIGVYFDPQRPRTISQTLDWALAPLGIVYPEQDGSELYIQVVKKPEDQTASTAFTKSDIIRVSTRQWAPPAYRVRVGYAERTKIDNPLPEDPADVEYLLQERSQIKKEDGTVQTNYPNALDLEARTPIFAEADADTVGDTLLALLKVKRDVYDVELAQKAFHAWVGDYVSIEHADAPKISSAKNVLVTGFTFDLARREIAMEAWG